ncbi:MAG: hypothetical protein QGG48_09145 [Desulfatiglandales bacterium]|jgi:hypothetical protein|nr:hypothetical protein [Desulfatiglandales bacterium]
MTDFKGRMIRAAKLDVNLYEEAEADRGLWVRPWGLLFSPV